MASEPTVCVDLERAEGGQAIAAGLATRAAVEALESKPYIGKAGVVAYLANAIGERAAAPQRSEPVRVRRSRCAAGRTATSPRALLRATTGDGGCAHFCCIVPLLNGRRDSAERGPLGVHGGQR